MSFNFEVVKSTHPFYAEGWSTYSFEIIKTLPYNKIFLGLVKKTHNPFPSSQEEAIDKKRSVLISLNALPQLIAELPNILKEAKQLQESQPVEHGAAGGTVALPAKPGMVGLYGAHVYSYSPTIHR